MTATLHIDQLIAVRACSEQVTLFRELFGESVNVTVAKARKVSSKFDWGFAARFLDAEGDVEYERATGPALTEYERVMCAAWASAYIATCHRQQAAKVPS